MTKMTKKLIPEYAIIGQIEFQYNVMNYHKSVIFNETVTNLTEIFLCCLSFIEYCDLINMKHLFY